MRCSLRPTETGWGVWDSGTNGLRSVCDERADAEKVALEMNLAYNQYGRRGHVDRRLPREPIPVQRWTTAGDLIAWVRDRGEWIGAVRGPNGEISWIPSHQLRQTPQPPG